MNLRLLKSFIVMLTGLTVLSGCAKMTESADVTGLTGNDSANASVSGGGSATEVMGTLGHGMAEFLTDEATGKSYIVYEGGELELKYGARASGMAEQGVGFMIFIDGRPQLYRMEDESGYRYMHTCYFQDYADNRFSFYLTPSTGQKGDELEIYIASVYYPEYKPDMVKSKGYGIFHHMTGSSYTLKYYATPVQPQGSISDAAMLSDIRIQERPIAEGEKITRMPLLYIDGQDVSKGNFYVTGEKKKLQVRLEVADPPGAEYVCTFFINHEAVSGSGDETPLIRIQPGKAAVIEAELDISALEGQDTFYAVLVPRDKAQIDELALGVEKANSVLLVKSGD